jgi:hypothetical protein
MPPRKAVMERNNEAEEIIQQDDPDPTKELLQFLKDQMTDLAAKNDATNAKLEMLSMQYQALHGNNTNEAVHVTPQASEVPMEPLRSTTLPQENRTAATSQSEDRSTKFPKIPYPVFDESGDPDWHIR